MIYLRHTPAPPLNEFVEHLWFYKGFFPDHSAERLIPDGAIEILFDLGGPPKRLYDHEGGEDFREFRRAWISGQHSGFIVIGTEQDSSMMGIRFRTGRAFPFLRFPVSELNDEVVGLECVWGREACILHERIAEAPTPEEKFQLAEQMLWNVARNALSADQTCDFALTQLKRAREELSICDLAGTIGLSQRQLLRRFDQHVGLGPKTLARVFRFQRVIQRLDQERRVHWVEIATEEGYYDQAHLVRDFRQFTGLNPSCYLVDKRDYGNYIPIL